jgi:hypothetical protein
LDQQVEVFRVRFRLPGQHSGGDFAIASDVTMDPAVPDERSVYGCVGADRPEAMPFIDEVDGILVYTCPACRLALAELDSLQPGR